MRSGLHRYALALAMAVSSVGLFVLLVTLPARPSFYSAGMREGWAAGHREVAGVAFLIALLVPVIARGFRAKVGPAAGLIAALVVVPWIPVLFLTACVVLQVPLVLEQAPAPSHVDPSEWGSLWLAATVVLGAGSGWVAKLRLGTPLRVAAVLATAVACVAAVGGLARIRRPDPASYLDRAPRTQPLLGLGSTTLGAGTFEYLMGDLGKTCVLRVRTPAYHTEEVVDTPPRCRGIAVVDDAVSDTYIVIQFQIDAPPAPLFALRRGTLEPVPVTLHDIAPATAPPHRWTLFGAAGAALALLWLVLGLRVRPQRFARAVDAHHSGDGWVRVEGAPPRHVPSLAGKARGPVALLVEDGGRSSYRHDGGVAHDAFAEVGTKAELVLRDDAHRNSLLAQALVTAALTLAPIVAAAAFGLR